MADDQVILLVGRACGQAGGAAAGAASRAPERSSRPSAGGPARELRRLGVRTWRRGPTAPRDAEGVESLSSREREVAALVLAGKRNAEIAEELVLSLKTIESHTRNVYAKLGVSSRVEFITRLSQRDRELLVRSRSTRAGSA